ncbi:MAG TPA: hypothetical protein VHY20_14115, partial [Pirellulales bacterium]|nr:hypothetical protein [Pirellulales bacterium]
MALNFEALGGQLGIDVGPWVIGFAKAGATLKKFAAGASATFQAVESSVRQMSAGIAAIGVAVGAGSAALVKLASNAEEAASKFQVVFGGATAETIKDLDAFGDAAGRSIFKLRDMAADLGALIGPMGFTEKQTGKMAAALTKLAVDLSSFHNVGEPDVLIALRSALAGEAEPMRRLGVQISEVKIQQEAMTAGLIRNKNEMTSAIKAQAIFNIIMRETAQAQGDAVRTGGGFANQIRRLRDGIFDAATVAGNVLLPVFTRAVNVLNGLMQPVKAQAKAWQEWATVNKDLLAQKTTEYLERLGSGMLEVWNAGKRMAGMVRGCLPQFDGLTARGKELYARFSQLWGRLPAWAQDLALVGGTMLGVSNVIGVLGGRIPIIGDLFLMLSRLLNPLGLLRSAFGLLPALIGAINVPLLAIGAAVGAMYLAIQNDKDAEATWLRIKDLARQLGDTVMRIAGDVMKWFNTAWKDSDNVLNKFVNGAGSLLLKTLEGTVTLLKAGSEAAEFFSKILAGDFSGALLIAQKAMLAFSEARLGVLGDYATETDIENVRQLRAQVTEATQAQIAAERERLFLAAKQQIADKEDVAILRDQVMPLWDQYRRQLDVAEKNAGAGRHDFANQARQAAAESLLAFEQQRDALVNKGKPAKPEEKPGPAAAVPLGQANVPELPKLPTDTAPAITGAPVGAVPMAPARAAGTKQANAWAAAFGNATREQATGMFSKMAPDLIKAMKPGPGGALNVSAATKVLNDYKAVLSTMPGFTAREFDRVALAIRQEMQSAASVPPEFREKFIGNIKKVVDGANKVFLEADAAAHARIATM